MHNIKITWRQFGDYFVFFFSGAKLLRNTWKSIFLISYSSHEYFFIQSWYNFCYFIPVQLFVHIQPHWRTALLCVPLQISLKMCNSCCNWFIGDRGNSALTWDWFHLQHNHWQAQVEVSCLTWFMNFLSVLIFFIFYSFRGTDCTCLKKDICWNTWFYLPVPYKDSCVFNLVSGCFCFLWC